MDPLSKWWHELPTALRPEPGADPATKDPSQFLEQLRTVWSSHSTGVMNAVEKPRRALRKSGRALGELLLPWVKSTSSTFIENVRGELERVAAEPDRLTRRHITATAGGSPLVLSIRESPRCWELFRKDGGRALLNEDTPLFRAVTTWLARHGDDVTAFRDDSLAKPLWRAIGHRAQHGEGEVPGAGNCGLWRFDAWTWMAPEWFANDGIPPLASMQMQSTPPSSRSIYLDVFESAWNAALEKLPRAEIADYHRAQAASSWTAAHVIDLVMREAGPEDFLSRVVQANQWVVQLSAPLRAWQLSGGSETAASCHVFDIIDHKPITAWGVSRESLSPSHAAPVASVMAFCVGRLIASLHHAGESGDSPSTKADTADAQGLVSRPLDPSAFVGASKILEVFPSVAPTHKALVALLKAHPEVHRWKPSKQRLCVHSGHFQRLADTLTAQTRDEDGLETDAAEIARRKKLIRQNPRA